MPENYELTDEFKSDEEAADPYCYNGIGEGKYDTNMPPDNCCRLYAGKWFTGKYIDFCYKAEEASKKFSP